jgi:hypothetical protein
MKNKKRFFKNSFKLSKTDQTFFGNLYRKCSKICFLKNVNFDENQLFASCDVLLEVLEWRIKRDFLKTLSS